MGVQLNKFRQASNIFLTLALLCVVIGVFIYFFTSPENRGTTFWMSMGLLLLSGILSAIFAARIAFSDDSRQPPHTFTQLILVLLYVVFVIVASIFNVFVKMSVLNYFLLHVAGGAVFLLPLQFVNMAALKSGGAKDVADKARNNLRDESTRVQNILSRIVSIHPNTDVAKLRKLADNLLYSEPAQAPKAVERALTLSIDDLEARLEIFLSDPKSVSGLNALSEAADVVDRALKARNEAILRSK
jgi:hypothetical protein